MNNTAREYINQIKQSEHTHVSFRYEGYGDNAIMEIDKFLEKFGDRKVSFNGDFYDENDMIMSAFIRRTFIPTIQ